MINHKDAPVINYSEETAEKKGTKKEWFLNQRENKECAEELIRQVNRNYGDFDAAIKSVLEQYQYPEERVKRVLANEIFPDQKTADFYEQNGKHIDKQVSEKNAKWAVEIIANQEEWDESVYRQSPEIRRGLSMSAVNSLVNAYISQERSRAERDIASKLKSQYEKG